MQNLQPDECASGTLRLRKDHYPPNTRAKIVFTCLR